jgi:2'-5' RNA ligase
MIRTFVAVELDSGLTQALAGVQEKLKGELHRLRPRVRLQWVRPDSVHLTLKFLGAIEQSQVGIIVQALESVTREHVPFSVDVKGFGVFPDLRSPRVLWMGLSGSIDRLIRLAGSIDAALIPFGFQAERKPYSPHLTMARVKEQSHAIGEALAESGVMRECACLGILSIQSVALMQSVPSPSGSIYSCLGRVLLGHESLA